MDSSQNNQDLLKARLRAQEHKLPSALQRLAGALWNPPAEGLSHEACRAALPQFVDDEIAGERVAETYAEVKHHLDECDSCSAEYAELLDGALAEERGLLPTPQITPTPDLTFLPTRAPVTAPSLSLPDLVLDWTRSLLATLAPGEVHDLGAIAETFFARVRSLKTFELRPRMARELGLGSYYGSPALSILSACYVTTQLLCDQITPPQLRDWAKQDILKPQLEARAAATAQQLGIERSVAQQFAGAYAEHAVQELGQLEALIGKAGKATHEK